MRLHLHRDPDWQAVGVWELHECRCGARRVRRRILNRVSPIPPGWPSTRDRHGVHRPDSGWRT